MSECPGAARTNCRKLGGLKQQKLILSPSWRPEAQNQGVIGAVLPLKALGEGPFLTLPALVADGPQHLGLYLHPSNLRPSSQGLLLSVSSRVFI